MFRQGGGGLPWTPPIPPPPPLKQVPAPPPPPGSHPAEPVPLAPLKRCCPEEDGGVAGCQKDVCGRATRALQWGLGT